MLPNDPDSERGPSRISRRRLLQMTGIGVGSLSIAGFGVGIATAQSTCAKGPFERRYTAESVNISKTVSVRDTYEKSEEYPSAAVGAFEKAEVQRDSGSPAPASGAQRPPRSDDLLTVGTEYDGIRDTALIEPPLQDPPIVAPSDSQIAVGRSKARAGAGASEPLPAAGRCRPRR